MQKKGIIPLFLRILICSTIIWVLLLASTLAITLQVSLTTLQEKTENTILSVSSSLSKSEMVRQALIAGTCPPSLISYLDDFVSKSPDMDVVTIANNDSIRLYHIVHSRIGQRFVGNDQGDVLKGLSYFSTATGTLGLQRRYFSPVINTDKKIIGFVMASTTMNQMKELRNEIFRIYSGLAGLLVLITVLFSSILTLSVRHALHGFNPEELVHTYLTQNGVLNNLDEGIISVDKNGCIQLSNRAAEEMLGFSTEALKGKALDDFLRDPQNKTLLGKRHKNIQTSHSNILACCIPLQKTGKRIESTLILTDKSEAIRTAEQLNGTRHIISALRANTHEFMNKMQIISGMLQMNKPREAFDYINSISSVQSKAMSPILQYIANTNVAALLLGKLNNAKEMNIEMTLLATSYLPRHSAFLTSTELVTVIGNLLENAIEAVNSQGSESPRDISLQITEDDNGLLIIISDTGIGMSPDIIKHIYDNGFSTKGDENRGIGMKLIHDIVDRNSGSIEVDSDPGSGTTFTLIFHGQRR